MDLYLGVMKKGDEKIREATKVMETTISIGILQAHKNRMKLDESKSLLPENASFISKNSFLGTTKIDFYLKHAM
jgi:hypothetical protein